MFDVENRTGTRSDLCRNAAQSHERDAGFSDSDYPESSGKTDYQCHRYKGIGNQAQTGGIAGRGIGENRIAAGVQKCRSYKNSFALRIV